MEEKIDAKVLEPVAEKLNIKKSALPGLLIFWGIFGIVLNIFWFINALYPLTQLIKIKPEASFWWQYTLYIFFIAISFFELALGIKLHKQTHPIRKLQQIHALLLLLVPLFLSILLSPLSIISTIHFFMPRKVSTQKLTPNKASGPNPIIWKTFSGSNYSLQYPATWHIASPGGGAFGQFCTKTTKNSTIIEISQKKLATCGFVGEQLPANNADITIWINSPQQNLHGILPGKSKITLIDGERAVEYPYTASSQLPNVQATRLYLNHNGKGFLIFLKQTDKFGNYDPIYNQILLRFKFTNPTATTAPAQKILCTSSINCPNGDTCQAWGPVIANRAQNKYCTSSGEAAPL